jgi:hypothetical protein
LGSKTFRVQAYPGLGFAALVYKTKSWLKIGDKITGISCKVIR